MVRLGAQTFLPNIPDILEGDLWAPFDPPVWEHPELVSARPGDDAAIARVMLEIARRAFSLMIFGGELTYTPYDRARGVAERVELRWNGEIPWGDPGLRVLTSHIDRRENTVNTRFRYHLNPAQMGVLRPWRSGALAAAGGSGTVPWRWDPEAYRDGIEQAVKEALREWLRARHFNKPREVRVRFVLREMPAFRLEAGQLVTRVKLLMLPPEVRDYRYF